MDIVYFEVDNWFAGRDYPASEPFYTWLSDRLGHKFADDEWAKENKLCIKAGDIDMSQCYLVSAPREWVEQNCSCLFLPENEKFLGKLENPEDLDSDLMGRLSHDVFLDYEEKNFGVHWVDFPYYESEDDDDLEEYPESES